jgi:(1->4)-alpha-D-glucan 1-alpha-D-glucosylmutase
VIRFAMKFQQYTAPVMAKAQEDTVFYRDYRLISLNEVGGDPRRFSVSRTTFHYVNKVRQENWPYAMLATSTHDSKRSEDVRARINVLSEIPTLWKKRVRRWQRLNRRHTRQVNGAAAPSPNDEYLLYQTLVGTFPIPAPTTGQELGRYQERMAAYMLKAVREAKVHTSWLNPDPCYEAAVASFVEALLNPGSASRFLADFTCFAQSISRLGLLNSLSQLLLKLTAPGIPDIYQGNELWNFSLVDPDNRRPVDFNRPRQMLASQLGEAQAGAALAAMLENIEDGRAKLLVTSQTLCLRRRHPALFAEGAYEVVPIAGNNEEHLCVIVRSLGGERLVAIAPRFFVSLLAGQDWHLSAPETVWGATRICLPASSAEPCSYRNIFSGELHTASRQDNQDVLMVSSLLRTFPVALLHSPAQP